MILHDITDNNFDDNIKGDKTFVDFFATWCGPCKMLSVELEMLAKENNSLKIVKVDVDKCPNIARKFGIMSVPTLLLYKDGNMVDKKTGYMPVENIKEWINNY